MKKSTKHISLCTASAVALMMTAAPVFAQDAGQSTAPDAAAAPADDTQTVVVVGIRKSLQRATDIKRQSPQVVDSIVADDIGKFPDTTTAGALQRVPGVQVTVGDNNEIVGPIVRGLGDIQTTLDGREIFSGTGRGFAFQDLPAEALARVDVYKSNAANMLEGGVAGTIDLHLHKAFDFKERTAVLNLRDSYASNSGNWNPSLGLLFADRWNTSAGEMGALIDVSYSSTDFNRPIAFNCDQRSTNHGPHLQDGSPVTPAAAAPTCVGGLNQYGNYERPQANASFQWRPSDELEVYVDGLYTGYRSEWNTAFILDDLFSSQYLSNVTVDSNCSDYYVNGAGFYAPPEHGGVTETLCNATGLTANNYLGFTSTQAHDDSTDEYLVATGFKFNSGNFHLNTDLSYQSSHNYTRNFIVDIGMTGIPSLTVITNDDDGTRYGDSSDPLLRPENFRLTHSLFQDFEDHESNEFAAAVDGRYDFDRFIKNVQFGVRVASRELDDQVYTGGPGAPNGDFNTLVSSLDLPSNFLVKTPGVDRIDGGEGFIVPNGDLLRDRSIQDKLRAIYGQAPGDPDYNPTQSYHATEDTYSGYLQVAYQAEIGGMQLDGQLGGRYTQARRSILGTGLVTPAATPGNPNPSAVLTPVNTSTDDSDFLPNFNARLKIRSNLQVRFSAAKTLARPSFGSLNPGLFYIVSANPEIHNSGNGGNPYLEAEKANAYDATLEYYMPHNGFLEVALYSKDITNRIINGTAVETIDGIEYNISRPRNVGSAKLQGLELSGQTFFDYLPGIWSGFGVFGNFTLADSEIDTPGDRLEGYELQGVSKYSYNVGLLYEKYGFSGRLAYTHRDKYYDEDRSGEGVILHSPNDPIFLNYVRPSGRLDFSISYDVTPKITVAIDGTNITNARYKSYYNIPLNPRDYRYDDSSYSIVMRAKF
jgi:TonB-dependent receptor